MENRRSLKPKSNLPLVRAFGQFGPLPKDPESFRLFLDDVRNPPLREKGWVIVRTVCDGINLLEKYGNRVTECSLDNDLNQKLEGYHFLQWILDHKNQFPRLKKIIIHTGNDPKARLMRKMLLGSPFIIKRIIPSDRIYPRASEDKRYIIPHCC